MTHEDGNFNPGSRKSRIATTNNGAVAMESRVHASRCAPSNRRKGMREAANRSRSIRRPRRRAGCARCRERQISSLSEAVTFSNIRTNHSFGPPGGMDGRRAGDGVALSMLGIAPRAGPLLKDLPDSHRYTITHRPADPQPGNSFQSAKVCGASVSHPLDSA